MTWKEKTIVRILLLIAQMIAEETLRKELGHLSNHITTYREDAA